MAPKKTMITATRFFVVLFTFWGRGDRGHDTEVITEKFKKMKIKLK